MKKDYGVLPNPPKDPLLPPPLYGYDPLLPPPLYGYVKGDVGYTKGEVGYT